MCKKSVFQTNLNFPIILYSFSPTEAAKGIFVAMAKKVKFLEMFQNFCRKFLPDLIQTLQNPFLHNLTVFSYIITL